MKNFFTRKSIASKIALSTVLAIVVVTAIFLSIFLILDVSLLNKLGLSQLILAFVGLLLIVDVALISLSTHLFVTKPLGRLSDTMHLVENGDLSHELPPQADDELGDLFTSFNWMLARLKTLDGQKMEAERALIIAQESLKYKGEIEEQSKIIRLTNEKLETSLERLGLLYTVSQILNKTSDTSEVLHAIQDILANTLKFKEFSLLFLDEKTEMFEVRVAYGFENNDSIRGMRFRPGEGITGKTALENRVIYIEDTTLEPFYLRYRGEKKKDGSFISLPISVGSKVVGVLNVGDERKSAFSKNDILLLEAVANQLAVSYDRSLLHSKTKELAVTDDLTGLFNRRHFQQVLQMECKRSHRFSHPLSLLIIDVDFFKNINDSYGHLQGDMVLKNLAKLLSLNVREVDTVARYGGEEFVIILADTSFENALKVGEQIRNIVEENCRNICPLLGFNQKLTVSIGVSSMPDQAQNEEELINSADLALYRAKKIGRNQVVGYEPSMAENQKKYKGFQVIQGG